MAKKTNPTRRRAKGAALYLKPAARAATAPGDCVVLPRAEYEALLQDARAKAVYDEVAADLLAGIEALLRDEERTQT